MSKYTEFAMVHPAFTLPGLWSVAQGRGNRQRAVSVRTGGVLQERALVPQAKLGLDVTGVAGDTQYRFTGPRRPSQTDLSYWLALVAHARPTNEIRLRVDLGSNTPGARNLRPQLPAPFRRDRLYGVETNDPNCSPLARVNAPETCSLEALMKDAGKSPDTHERAAFWRFVQTVSPITFAIAKHRDGEPEIIGGIPFLMYHLCGTCIELWFNPLQSGILKEKRGGSFAMVSLAERNQISGDVAKHLHFMLSARVQHAKPYTIRREELLALLYAEPTSSPQTAYQRRLVLDSALAKLAAVGWTIREVDDNKVQIMRPKRSGGASEE